MIGHLTLSKEEKKAAKGFNFIGKFTNLVSADLDNTVGEGFPYVAHLADPPDQFVYCVPKKPLVIKIDAG